LQFLILTLIGTNVSTLLFFNYYCASCLLIESVAPHLMEIV